MSHGSVSTRDAEGFDSLVREARTGARFGWISTIAWIVLGMDSILRPVQDNRRDVFWWFPFAFMMLAIVAVHRVQRWRGLPVERYTYYSVMFASALALLGNLGLVFNMPLLAKLGSRLSPPDYCSHNSDLPDDYRSSAILCLTWRRFTASHSSPDGSISRLESEIAS